MSTQTKPVGLPNWPKSPPLTNITALSSLVMTPPWNYTLNTPKGDPRESLGAFLGSPLPADIDQRAYGNLSDMIDVHHNVALGSEVVGFMAQDLYRVCTEKGVPPNPRLLISARLCSLGVSKVTSAHVLHVRPKRFFQTSALGLLRTGIELIGRAGWVALGTGDEPHRVAEGHRLNARQRAELRKTDGASACLKSIARFVQGGWAGADSPVDVYEWLCSFTHFDGGVVERLYPETEPATQLVEDTFVAMAYVAWLGAIIGGEIIGQRVAKAPRLPPKRPWTMTS